MRLNTLSPADNSKFSPKRLGRGIGSGLGKTCGKGHKGQKARSGGYHKVGFEGGQMPIQRRLPKFGFTSRKCKEVAQVRLSSLGVFGSGEVINLDLLKLKGLVRKDKTKVRIYLSGSINLPINIASEIYCTKGVIEAVQSVGGKYTK